jgi:glycosyltransferase involved in cell wall biosynthesis
MGSAVAHSELLIQGLRLGLIDCAHLIAADTQLNLLSERHRHAAFAELVDEFGPKRICSAGLFELPTLFLKPNAVLVGRAPQNVAALYVRDAIPESSMPTCALVHSVAWPNLLGQCMSLLCSMSDIDTLVVTSNAARRALECAMDLARGALFDRLKVKPPDIAIHQIPLGINCEAFERCISKVDTRRILGIPTDSVSILYFGRLDEGYKADLGPLLRAFRALRNETAGMHFILAGADPGDSYRPILQQSINALELSTTVSVISNVTPAEKRLLYSSADIFVSPVDNIQESFGLSLLEAMASALPVVASDWSGYRDIVLPNVTGFLAKTYWSAYAGASTSWLSAAAPTAELDRFLARRTAVDVDELTMYLRSLVRDPDLRRRLGSAARERAETLYSWRAVLGQFQDLWLSQIDRSKDIRHRPRKLHYVNEAFSHYATTTVREDTRIIIASHGNRVTDEAHDPINLSVPQGSGLRSEMLSRIFIAVSENKEPIRISEIKKHLGSCEDEIMFLLKRDAIRVWRPAQVNG